MTEPQQQSSAGSEDGPDTPDEALDLLMHEAGWIDMHGGDHHEDDCPVCRSIAIVRAALASQPSPAATVDRSEWAINGAHEFAETMRAAPVDHLLQKAVFASGEIVQDHLPDCSAGNVDACRAHVAETALREVRRYCETVDLSRSETLIALVKRTVDAALALSSDLPQGAGK